MKAYISIEESNGQKHICDSWDYQGKGLSILQEIISDVTAKLANNIMIHEQFEDAWIIAANALEDYPEDIQKAIRIWVYVMPGMLFVADYIESSKPVRLSTGFIMNNEDDSLNTNVASSSRLVFRRGAEAMKLFNFQNLADEKIDECELDFDGTHVRFVGREEGCSLRRVHLMMMDEEINIKKWHGKEAEDYARIEAPDRTDFLDFKFNKEGFTVRRNNRVGCWKL